MLKGPNKHKNPDRKVEGGMGEVHKDGRKLLVALARLEGCRVRQPTLKVDSGDRIKLSSLHRSGNRKLLQVENRISNYTFVTQKWERRVNSNEGNYIY
jgi:hypothetical protein